MRLSLLVSALISAAILGGCNDDDTENFILLNEIKANIAEDKHAYQYIELRGTPGMSLKGYRLLVLDGDPGEAGHVDFALDLSNHTVGANGLVLIKNADLYNADAEAATTRINDARIRDYDADVDGDDKADGAIEHESITFMLVKTEANIADGADLDANDDGTLELPASASVVDSVGWIYEDGGTVYTTAALSQSASGPDAATRFYDKLTPNSLAAWSNGDVFEDPDQDDEDRLAAETRYDPAQASANLPPSARLTPGGHNYRAAPFVLLNEVVTTGASKSVELLSNAAQDMKGLYLVGLAGDGKGTVNLAADLSGISALESGLTLITPTGSALTTGSAIAKATRDLGALTGGTQSLLLVYSPSSAIKTGQTLDANGDGTLELPSSAQVVDSIAWGTNAADKLYGDSRIITGYAMHALSRYKDNRLVDGSSWTYGQLDAQNNYDPANSKNIPADAMANPGEVNVAAFTSLIVKPVIETARTTMPGPDADDVAFWIHPTDPTKSMIIATQKEAGYSIYDIDGKTLLDRLPAEIRYNNVDVIYGFNLGGETIDVALFSDRKFNKFILYKITTSAPYLEDITDYASMELFTAKDPGEDTAYGEAVFKSPVTGKFYAYATQAATNLVRQFELVEKNGKIGWNLVRTITLAAGDDDEQAEGMVVDQEYGVLYISQEPVGVYRVNAEPDGGDVTLDEDNMIVEEGDNNVAEDVEGLTLYYKDNGEGYLMVSSQGNFTYAVFDRKTNAYIRSFVIADDGKGIDGAQETDSLDVTNIPLGTRFPHGVLIVQDGIDTTADPNDTETNFKWVPWEDVAKGLGDTNFTSSYNPRSPVLRY